MNTLTKTHRIGLALVALLVACGAVAFSSASFLSTASTGPDEVHAGTLKLSSPASGSSFLDLTDVRPGMTREQVTTVTNSGNAPGNLFLAVASSNDSTPVAPSTATIFNTLQLQVAECADAGCSGTPVVKRSFTDLGALSTLGLGQIDAGATRYLRLSVRWLATDDDQALYGKTGDLQLRWAVRNLEGGSE